MTAQTTQLTTPRTRLTRGLTNNSTNTTPFAAAAITSNTLVTIDDPGDPSNNAVIITPEFNLLELQIIGGDAADEALKFRVTAYIPANRKEADNLDTVFLPRHIGTWDATLGSLAGIDGKAIDDTEFVADTIVADGAVDETAVQATHSPADNTAAYLILDAVGATFFKVEFLIDTAAGANVLYRSF